LQNKPKKARARLPSDVARAFNFWSALTSQRFGRLRPVAAVLKLSQARTTATGRRI